MIYALGVNKVRRGTTDNKRTFTKEDYKDKVIEDLRKENEELKEFINKWIDRVVLDGEQIEMWEYFDEEPSRTQELERALRIISRMVDDKHVKEFIEEVLNGK
jgi:cysteinyl-tRNA synthetase